MELLDASTPERVFTPHLHPLPRMGEATSRHARYDHTASTRNESPLLFARGEGKGEELIEF
jgi:hypothetical protein